MNADADIWERLNAYHDGELDRSESAALRAQMKADPTLRAALDDISELSAALKPLHPVAALPRGSKPDVRRFQAGFIPAAAAAVAIIAGALLYSGPDPAKTPLEWHQTFVTRTYPVQAFENPTPVSQWIGNDLDLSSANLTLVDVATLEHGDVYLHYTGINGCRLTVAALSTAPVLPAASNRVLVQAWSVGATYYAMLAVGMDRGKFAAISNLLKNQTDDSPGTGDALFAMREATSHSVPCA